MKFESIPEKRIIPPKEDSRITQRKYDTARSLLDGELDSKSPKERPTALDFHILNPSSTEEDYFKWIERELGISEEIINGKSEESEQAYKLLNYAYLKGKDFLKNTLKYKDEEVDIGPDSIKSKKELFDLLSKTTSARGNGGLSKSLLYCRLVKVAVAAYETLKNDAEMLKEATLSFEDDLISRVSIDDGKDTPLILINEDEKGKHFYASKNGHIKGVIQSRGKDLNKSMLRFINRPESSAKTALTDGIASRITIEKDRVVDLAPIICDWLSKEQRVDSLEMENHSFLSPEEMFELRKILGDNFPNTKFILKDEIHSVGSMGGVEDFRIKGTLQPLEKKKFISMTPHARQFEIQFVEPNNKNEKGKRNHEIYDLVKFVTARTRLDGGCPAGVFDEFVKDASVKSGISEKNIRNFVLNTENCPILKMKKKNERGYYYIAHSVYSRWDGFKWVDPTLSSEIEKEKLKNKE